MIKPVLVREQTDLRATIWVDDNDYKHFYNPWHYHPELELTLVVKSYGLRHVGDNIENFSAGDLVLVGSNLPHLWLNDNSFIEEDSRKMARAVVVKFRPDFVGEHFLNLPEMKLINELIKEKAAFGIKLKGDLRDGVEAILLNFSTFDNSNRLIQLLNILDRISKSGNYSLLSSISYRNSNTENAHRINLILDYLTKNYQNELSLETVAAQINMNRNAFCRFFKKGTRKSLFTVINEVRISKACNLLIETKMDVVQICYAVGYNNISNFYKAFKKIKGVSPLVYKKKITM